MIRLMEVLLHGGATVGGWRARALHRALLTARRCPPPKSKLETAFQKADDSLAHIIQLLEAA